MKQRGIFNIFIKFIMMIFIFSIILFPSFSYAESKNNKLNTLESANTSLPDEEFVVLDVKTGKVVDEITSDELEVKTRSVTTNHTEPYKVPLRAQNEISTRAIIGGDERTVVSHPYNEVAYLSAVIGGVPYASTAVMIYKNLALTAAHCIYYNNQLFSGAEVFPERMRGNSPYGSALVTQCVMSKSYYENQNPEADWAMLILDRNIGEQSGWQAIAYSEDYSYYANGENVNVTGYPSEKENGDTQYTATGPVKKATQNYLLYDVDATSGQSGGPVYDKNGYVIGVHKGALTEWGVTWNRGININKERFDVIVSYMN